MDMWTGNIDEVVTFDVYDRIVEHHRILVEEKRRELKGPPGT
jgi:hypothetical protein